MLNRSPLSGPSSPPSCSLGTSASAPMRWGSQEKRRFKPVRCLEETNLVFLFQSESFEVARIFSEAEARRVGSLLQISSEALQTVITHRVTVSYLECSSDVSLPFTFLYMWPDLSSTGDHLRQDLLPSVCGECHRIQVRMCPQLLKAETSMCNYRHSINNFSSDWKRALK